MSIPDHNYKELINSGTYEKMNVTLPKTNIAPENRPSQKESCILTIHFQGQAVSFREVTFFGGV